MIPSPTQVSTDEPVSEFTLTMAQENGLHSTLTLTSEAGDQGVLEKGEKPEAPIEAGDQGIPNKGRKPKTPTEAGDQGAPKHGGTPETPIRVRPDADALEQPQQPAVPTLIVVNSGAPTLIFINSGTPTGFSTEALAQLTKALNIAPANSDAWSGLSRTEEQVAGSSGDGTRKRPLPSDQGYEKHEDRTKRQRKER